MSSILFTIEQHVAYIQLNRPDKFNAFNRDMSLALQQRLDECAASEEVRCIYLTGAGKGFSSGQDLTEVTESSGLDTKTIISEHYNPIVRKIRNLNKPVLAAVNGVAAGAGANVALCCDVVIASESAHFIQAFSKIGLVPDSGGTFFLPRLVGWQKASALALLGEKLTAAEAERIGMIYKVFPDDVFEQESKRMALTLAQMPTRALMLIKQALNASFTQSLDQQLALEERLQIEASRTEDFKEGVAAFAEKRKPIFKGR
jgi:2-(1,2-epoxy-1,2-dihydrophenyl)acetyl-CoA isomerase